jgi:1-acyl-sn-glycerol-3-phosphate acyltransferase
VKESPVVDERSGVLARLVETPAALARSSRRLGRATRLTLEVMSHTRQLFPRGAGEFDQAEERLEHLNWLARNMCAIHGIRVLHRGPVPASGSVIVANHLGYLDPVALESVAPAVAIAKSEVADWPILGEAVSGLGTLFVARGDAHSGAVALRRALRLLERGISIMAFPEGTTSRGFDVLPMRRGVFGIAARIGAPIVPATIRYARVDDCWVDDQFFVPHYLRLTTRPGIVISVEFDEPFVPHPGDEPEALAEVARTIIRRNLAPGPTS